MIKIICVGKIKEKFYRDAIDEYLKRLSKYTKISIMEVDDIDYSNPEVSMQKEKDLILKYVDVKDYIITLEIEGQKYNSMDLSKKIDKILSINPNITFIIGGSYGLSLDIKKLSNMKLSFSDLTFPHQLFRIMLLEQIYRSYKILNNESYHK
ncbi:MAG: 23S rRNA (pseudouridine(1915)-N(3))-methyltransferase RlmH [Firmicutes bacterium]|nr:23S rRNA (pseudouridine(1915)-N(3))-methyltransferase RlmH [Bacillota bacterium]